MHQDVTFAGQSRDSENTWINTAFDVLRQYSSCHLKFYAPCIANDNNFCTCLASGLTNDLKLLMVAVPKEIISQ